VQGVGFRFFTHAARQQGINGWVRNTPGGDVEIEAEGDREAMLGFEAQVRIGPPGARVDEVDVDERVPVGRGVGFSVRD
jgi:acylphosphatase